MIFFFFFCTVGTLPWRQQPPQPLLPLFSHNSIKAVLTGALSHVCSWCWCVSVALLELCTLSVCCRCPMMSVSIDTALLLHLCTHPACSYPPHFLQVLPFCVLLLILSLFICLILSHSSFSVILLHIWAQPLSSLSLLSTEVKDLLIATGVHPHFNRR